MNVLTHLIRSTDAGIYNLLSSFAGNWFLDRLVDHEEANNLLKGGFFFAIYWALWFRTGPDQERRRRSIIMIVIGAILAIVITRTVAFIAPFRIRPMYDPTLTHPAYSLPATINFENWSSFPSDTAAYFSALAFGIAYLVRAMALPISLYTVGWVCLPRIYLGVHYPSDILAGILIGITTVWVSLRSGSLESIVTRPLLRAEEKTPEWFYAIAFLVSFEMATVFDGCRLAGRAVLHAALAVSRIRYSHGSSPLEEWGGFVAIAAFLLITVYLISVLSPKVRRRLTAIRVEPEKPSCGGKNP
jgi:membrane-associated phospholipid phosphatase